MTTAPADSDSAAGASTEPRQPTRPGRPRPWLVEGLTALVVWAAGSAAAVPLHALDPISGRVQLFPVMLAFGLAAVLFVLYAWRPRPVVVGLVVGSFAAWVTASLLVALAGTAFGYNGLVGDAGRLSAQVVRYTVASGSADPNLPSTASEYPPLWAWLVGKSALLLGRPGWTTVGPGEVFTVSFAVVAGYWLWRRLLDAPQAVVAAVVVPVVFPHVNKAYEILSMAVFVPLAIAVLSARGRREAVLPWWVAGPLGGLVITLYPADVVYVLAGVVAYVAWRLWREPEQRREYATYLALVAGGALVVSSWYTVPYVALRLTHPGEMVSDLYVGLGIITVQDNLAIAHFTLLGLLSALGLLALASGWRSSREATAATALAVGAFAYLTVLGGLFLLTGHSNFFHYSARIINTVLVTAGVVAVARVWPRAAASAGSLGSRSTALMAGSLLLLLLAFDFHSSSTFGPAATADTVATGGVRHESGAAPAHSEFYPDCRLPKGAGHPNEVCFPAAAVRRAVISVLGDDALPVTLSYDDRLVSFYPWYLYLSCARESSPSAMQWDTRLAEVRQLAQLEDPVLFASAAGDMPHGEIDVFVLRPEGHGRWEWSSLSKRATVVFHPRQFDPQVFDVQKVTQATATGGRVSAVVVTRRDAVVARASYLP